MTQETTGPRTETCPFCEGHGCPECDDLGTLPVLDPRPLVPGKSVRQTTQAAFGGRVGDWLQTFTGRPFWPLDPRPEEIDIEDIAQALSLKCRYGGHCLCFYSVAEHSVLVSQHVAPEHALWALLHDAGEAYLADIPRPVKPSLAGWKAIEARVMRAVCDCYGLPHDEPKQVKAVDFAITTDEKIALMADGPAWTGLAPPIGAVIRGLAPADARASFMARFEELAHGR